MNACVRTESGALIPADIRPCSECGGTGAIPAANPEQDQDNGYAPCPECSPEVES